MLRALAHAACLLDWTGGGPPSEPPGGRGRTLRARSRFSYSSSSSRWCATCGVRRNVWKAEEGAQRRRSGRLGSQGARQHRPLAACGAQKRGAAAAHPALDDVLLLLRQAALAQLLKKVAPPAMTLGLGPGRAGAASYGDLTHLLRSTCRSAAKNISARPWRGSPCRSSVLAIAPSLTAPGVAFDLAVSGLNGVDCVLREWNRIRVVVVQEMLLNVLLWLRCRCGRSAARGGQSECAARRRPTPSRMPTSSPRACRGAPGRQPPGTPRNVMSASPR
jgi:hypothetical protein